MATVIQYIFKPNHLTLTFKEKNMINIDKVFKDSINRRWTVFQVLDELLVHDYTITNSGRYKRINPCPITGSEHNAFSVWTDDYGTERYSLFSSNYNSHMWDDLPTSGTAADLIACIANDQAEILDITKSRIFKPRQRLGIIHQLKEKEVVSVSKVEAIFDEWNIKMANDLINFKPALQYYCETRHFKPETVKHFNIGYKGAICEDDEWFHQFAFPFYMDNRIWHIKYKVIESGYSGDFKTSQLGQNSGGDYFFNENDLYSKKSKIIVCEGEHDAMRIWETICRIDQDIGVIATSGNIGEEKWRKLKEAEKKFILAFDNDEAGKKYDNEFVLRVRMPIARLVTTDPSLKDPDEWLRHKKGRIQ